VIRTLAILSLLLGATGLGCATHSAGATATEVPSGSYAGLFDATRRTLAEYRFTLDRVDAARGVITTAPKQTAGLATPWDREQSKPGQRVEDLIHQQERVVRVVFEPPEDPSRVSVEVVVQRVRRPNWRVESDAIRTSTHARDPMALRSGRGAEYREPVSEDRLLAARLLARIRELAGLPSEAPAASEGSGGDGSVGDGAEENVRG
tara:strand:+ start:13459 stop:14076 length:618 start_codon:yes stop_codon:yes gene_type:complete